MSASGQAPLQNNADVPPNTTWPIKDREGYITVPFAFGSIAFWQGKRAPEFQTHRVIFQLHPSFNNPTRVVDAAPFHVTELGWGEFDIGIKIYFHEGPEAGLELKHQLQLFPKQGEASMKRPVVHERYDELVFNQPSESLMQRIHMCNSRLVPTPAGNYQQLEPHFTPFYYHDELLRMQAAQRRVQAETELLKEEYEKLEVEHALVSDEVRRLESGQAPKKI